MKHLKPPQPSTTPPRDARRQRRAAFRFGFSAVIASFVVLGLLILGAMFQEEYEEGFVRIVSYAVRLASPEELAEAEAAGPVPGPLPVSRPDTPATVSSDPLMETFEWAEEGPVFPAPGTLIPIEDFVIDTPDGLQLVNPDVADENPQAAAEETAETE